MVRRRIVGTALVVAVALSALPASAQMTRVFDITFADITGWTASGCCAQPNYLVAPSDGAVLSAPFTDTIGDGAIQSVTVEVAIEHICRPNAMRFSFNGQELGLWDVNQGPDCDCGDPLQSIASFTLNTPDYNLGTTNTVTILNEDPSVCDCCQAISGNSAWAADVPIRVTVTYAAPVPATPWKALAVLSFMLAAGGVVALRRQAT